MTLLACITWIATRTPKIIPKTAYQSETIRRGITGEQCDRRRRLADARCRRGTTTQSHHGGTECWLPALRVERRTEEPWPEEALASLVPAPPSAATPVVRMGLLPISQDPAFAGP